MAQLRRVYETELYSALGLYRHDNPSEQTIRSAYTSLAKKYHPDLNKGDTFAENRFKVAAAAYAILKDSKKRGLYDECGANGLALLDNSKYRKAFETGGISGLEAQLDIPDVPTSSANPARKSHKGKWFLGALAVGGALAAYVWSQ